MAKNLTLASVIEKNKIASGTPYLVLLETTVLDQLGNYVETIRVVRNSEDVVFEGNAYVASAFNFELESEGNAMPEVSVSIPDYTRAIQARLQEYGGAVGSKVRIIVANADNLAAGADADEEFFITGTSAQDYGITWKLGAENALALTFPRGRQLRDRCRWRFKSPECGYTGNAPECDLTVNGQYGCRVKENTVNFGGFPGIRPSNERRFSG